MDFTIIFFTSTLFQLLAAILAWRLILLALKKAAWAFIALAISLIVVHRSISFYHRVSHGYPFDPTAELLFLIISVLMLAGVVRIGPLFIAAKNADEARRESEERFRAVVMSATDAIIAVDGRGDIVYWNKSAQIAFGYAPEEVLGRPVSLLIPERFRQAHLAAMKRFLASGEPAHIGKTVELAGLRKDGGEFPLELSLSTWETKKGKFFSASIRDITQRKLAEEILRKQFAFEQALIDTIPFPVFYKDAQGLYIGCNKAFQDFFGWSKEFIIGKSVYDLAPKEIAEIYHEQDRQLFENPGTQVYEFVTKDLSGNLHDVIFHKASFADHNGGVGGIVGAFLDITERKRAEDLSKLNEMRLAALQRLNQMSEASLRDITTFALEEATRLTGSTIGYLAFMNEEESVLTMHTWSETAMQECRITDKPRVYPLESTGLWGEAVRQRRAVITNDYAAPNPWKKGCPEGHVQVRRHLNAPVFDGQKIVIVAGVGNKPSDYDESDVRQLTLLMEGMWRIIQRTRAEEALRESEQKYRFLVSNIPAVVFKGYADYSVEFFDDKIAELTGYRKEEFNAKTMKWSDVILKEELPGLRDTFIKALKTNKAYIREYRIRIKNGEIRWVQARGQIFCVPDGQIDFINGVFFDVTEQKLAKMARQESEERYRTLVENIFFGISLIDTDFKIKMVNTATRNMIRKSQEELINQECFRVFEKREAVCPHCPGQKAMATGLPAMAETEGVRDDGSSFPVRVSAFPLFGPTGKATGFIETVEDITETKKLAEERLRFSKLESLGLLAGGIAHDFNNILTAILGNISLAMMQLPEKDRVRDRLLGSEKACLQAQALAQQLLTFAKGGAPVKKLISLAELIQESANFASRGSLVRCEFNLDDGLPGIEADPGQIGQALQNLLINAIQAMPAGGVIEVRAVNHRLADLNDLFLEAGKYVKVSIQDQGLGIPAEYLHKIFDPYFTTKQTGSGLGLATTFSIIKNHNGHISVESALGLGTTFHIYLPASDQAVSRPPATDQSLFSGKGKILVMDDEEVVREVLGKMLSTLGYEASFARDGAEAINQFSESLTNGDQFAAVILDLTVPGGMGGKESFDQLRQIDPQIKALVSSGYSDDPVMADFKKYGFSGVIAKPYKVSDLSKILKELLMHEPQS